MNQRITHYEKAIRAIERGNGPAGPTAADRRVIDGYRAEIAALRDEMSRRLGESLAEVPPGIPTYAGSDGRRYTIPE